LLDVGLLDVGLLDVGLLDVGLRESSARSMLSIVVAISIYLRSFLTANANSTTPCFPAPLIANHMASHRVKETIQITLITNARFGSTEATMVEVVKLPPLAN